jgi:sporulation protein YlmC with PRC-barrel domain
MTAKTLTRAAWLGFLVLLAGPLAYAQESAGRSTSEKGQVAISHVFRSADLIGLDVKNKAGEEIANINDLVVDLKSGEVRYAALSSGGVAGFGGKMFAVPWHAMTFMMGAPNDADARYFVFDVTKEQLEQSEGFDTSKWPNVASPKWASMVKGDHAKNESKAETANGTRPTVAYETVFRASKIKGLDVRNDANEDLGDVDEVVIDVTKGAVKYLVLSHGTLLTGGNKLFAVPLNAITLAHASDKSYILFNVSQDALKNAPGFDKNNWPNMGDPTWTRNVDTYHERITRRPTTRQ